MNIATMYNKGNNLANNNNNNNNSSTSNLNNSSATTIITRQSVSGSTTGRIEWSRATILDFIEDYRRQRVLWDPNNKGYHIKQTKYEALKLLGQKYGAEIRSIRSKIKSLRSSFHREHGKVLNSMRKGLNYQPMWFAYDAIRFILDGESGDSDEADTKKNDPNNRETALSESNSNKHASIIDEGLLEERKISSRDIEHFNNHFLALGLQARHPMVVIAAVEAAAAASAAQERRQEQKYALKQEDIDSATQLKLLELSTNATTTHANTTSYNNTMNLTSTSATFNPISKPFNSLKSLSPIATISSVPITTVTLSNTTTTLSQQQQQQEPQLLPRPSPISTCSLESLNALHGSRSLDENSLSALVSATAIPSLSITAVARNSDYDSSEYCNISADDVKTEIFESDSTDLLESARTSTPVPLNCHKNATDLTTHKNNTNNKLSHESGNGDNSKNAINGSSRTVGSRKRKPQKHTNLNYNEDAPTSSKLHQKQQQQQKLQHSNFIHSRQNDYINRHIKKLKMKETIDNNENNDEKGNDDVVDDHDRNHDHDNEDPNDDNDDDGAGYFTSFSHLQTTLINSNNSNSSNNNIHLTTSNSNSKLSNINSTNNNNNSNNTNTNTNNNIPIDEYGVFGEYVAITIRKLKTSKAKIVVKHLINNLLYEAEMGKYDQGISSNKEPPELYKM